MWAWMGSWQWEHWLMAGVWLRPLLLLPQIQKHCHKYKSTNTQIQNATNIKCHKYKSTATNTQIQNATNTKSTVIQTQKYCQCKYKSSANTNTEKLCKIMAGVMQSSSGRHVTVWWRPLLVEPRRQRQHFLETATSTNYPWYCQTNTWYCQTNKSYLLSDVRIYLKSDKKSSWLSGSFVVFSHCSM